MYKTLLIFLVTIAMHGQDLKPVAKGTITVSTGQKLAFANLRFDDGKVIFFNIEYQKRLHVFSE